jgi:hypothetical protein
VQKKFQENVLKILNELKVSIFSLISIEFEEFEKQVDMMTEDDILDYPLHAPIMTESPDLNDIKSSYQFAPVSRVSEFNANVNTSLNTLMQSSFQTDLQTVTLSSMDSSDLNINSDNVFGGNIDIEEAIKK